MDISRMDGVPAERPAGAGMDGDGSGRAADGGEDAEGVGGGVGEGRVAVDGADAEEGQGGVVGCEEDGEGVLRGVSASGAVPRGGEGGVHRVLRSSCQGSFGFAALRCWAVTCVAV